MNKLAGIQYTNQEFEEIKRNFFNRNDKYLVKYDTIYQLFYSLNAGLYAQKIYTKPKNSGVGFMRRGRHMFTDGKDVNALVGFKLVNE